MSPTSYRTAPPRAKFIPAHQDHELNDKLRIPDGKSETCNLKSEIGLVGLGRVELPTSRLSGVRSNQLSYRPSFFFTAIFAANKSHTSLLRSVINGGHAGGPCSFGGYLKIACDLLSQIIKEQKFKETDRNRSLKTR